MNYIVTSRLKLRLIASSDLQAIHDLHSIPEVDQYNTLGIPDSVEKTMSVIAPWIAAHLSAKIQKYTLAILDKSDDRIIGLFGLTLGDHKYSRAEIWYIFHPDYWNRGYATESVRAVLDYGFDVLKLHRIEAGCAVDNIGSIKVLEKAGMTREGRHRQILPLKSGWSDNYTYAILSCDERPDLDKLFHTEMAELTL